MAKPRAVEATESALPWWIGFSLLTVLALLEIWLPLGRISSQYEINYNEGWNAYPQQAVAEGKRIYGQAPDYVYVNYPPLSFHVVGTLARLTHDVNGTARWISLLSVIALVVLTGLTVRRLTGSPRSALFSVLSLVIFIGALKADRIGMNDPHLLGMAFVAFGFYAYVHEADSPRWLRISAIAFVLGLFTKHTLLAFPIAVAIQLFLTSKKRLVTWISTAAIASALLLTLTFLIDGSHFLEHLMLPRVYSYAFFLSNTLWYLLILQTAIVVCLLWCFPNAQSGKYQLLVWSFAASHVLAFFFSGGAGADLNHLFDPAVAIAMIGGAALPSAEWAAGKVRYRNTLLTTLLIVPFFLGVLAMLPSHLQEDAATRRAMPQLEQEFASAVEFVKSKPGPALCESLLLCFDAGKPDEFDPYMADQLVKTGKRTQAEVLKLLTDRHFAVVQLSIDAAEPIAAVERQRFSQPFMATLLKTYRLAVRTSAYALFTPSP